MQLSVVLCCGCVVFFTPIGLLDFENIAEGAGIVLTSPLEAVIGLYKDY